MLCAAQGSLTISTRVTSVNAAAAPKLAQNDGVKKYSTVFNIFFPAVKCILNSAVCSVQCTVYTVYSTHRVQCTQCTVHTAYSAHIQCTAYSVQFTVYCVQCTQCTVLLSAAQCTLNIFPGTIPGDLASLDLRSIMNLPWREISLCLETIIRAS